MPDDKPHLYLTAVIDGARHAHRLTKEGRTAEALEHVDAIDRLTAEYRTALGTKPSAPADQAGDDSRLQDRVLDMEAELAKLRDLLRSETQRANDAIDREETAEQAAIEAHFEVRSQP